MNKILRIFLVICAVLIQFIGTTQNNSLSAALQKVLDSIVLVENLPGATFTALLPSGEKISIASGYSDRGKHIPMKPGDCMLAGSVGKTIVAATLLKLAGQKKIGIDDSVKSFFKGEEWFERIPNGRDLTVRMLMDHTSGIPEYVYDTAIWAALRRNPDKTWTGEERLNYSCKQQAEFPAGKGWSYADANYILLGMIIEKAGGKNFYFLADEFFLNPLHLEHTKAAVSRDLPCLVQGYTSLSMELLLPQTMINNGKYAFNPQLEWTGGGFLSNTDDLALWARNLYAGNVLSREMKAAMIDDATEKNRMNPATCYGLGVMVGRSGSEVWYGHTGFAPGYITVMEYLPQSGLAMALQVNTDRFRSAREACFDRMKKVSLLYLQK
jgi:D-alanyl-D-alanine carboxypeptidase